MTTTAPSLDTRSAIARRIDLDVAPDKDDWRGKAAFKGGGFRRLLAAALDQAPLLRLEARTVELAVTCGYRRIF